MPLVILSGLPSSGKSTRAQEIAELLRKQTPSTEVYVITDDFSTVSKNQLYSSSKEEKTARVFLKSKVERLLSHDCHVILDSLNYIKGFRYELYCLSKLLKTTQCTVHCDTPTETAREWNSRRPLEEQYTMENFEGLALRYESPDSRNRWDSPLFVLYPTDPFPEEAFIAALLHRKPPPPNQSTQSQPLTSVNFLHELDRQTQAIISTILELQRQGLLSGSGIVINGTDERLCIRNDVTMAELRRFRHQFITYTKLHPFDDVGKIPTLFVQYLNTSV